MQPNEVMIDGVRYVPASNAVANADAILKALVAVWWGDGVSPEKVAECMTYLRVEVHDNDEGGETLQDFMATLSRTLNTERNDQ
jgi:hypothetical protein